VRACSLFLRVFLCVLCDSAVSASLFAGGQDNPLFRQLRNEGVVVTADANAPLPAPRMADRLDAAGQRAVLEKAVGKRFTVGEFTAKVGTAPHVYAIQKIAVSGDDAPARAWHRCLVHRSRKP
jgi:hypothetical protein